MGIVTATERCELSMHTHGYLRIGFLCLLFLIASSKLFAQGDPIEKRRQLMEANNEVATKSITRAVREGNYAEIPVKVKLIMDNMDTMLEFFPAGSLSEKSRAKPEIWEKWDEFSKQPGKVKKAYMVKNLPTYVYFKGYRLLSNRDICTPLSYKENKHSKYFSNCFGISADTIKKLAGSLPVNVAIVNK